jgi:SAM-dependent methyltransferase
MGNEPGKQGIPCFSFLGLSPGIIGGEQRRGEHSGGKIGNGEPGMSHLRGHMKTKRPFEVLYRKYDSWYEEEPGRSLFAIEARAVRESLLFPPEKALEIGVGSGRFAGELSIRFGLDPAVHPLRLARYRGVLGVAGTGEWLPFCSKVFDTCLLMVTLCFVENPLAVVRESFRILSPGGQVILGMVLDESPWGKAYRALGTDGHPFYSLARFYRAGEILDWLKEAGFFSVRIISTLFQPPGRATYDPEFPRPGYDPAAGFTVFRALKPGT